MKIFSRKKLSSVLSYVANPTQVMSCRPRSDLFINLPALRKLDNMLLVSINQSFSLIIT